MVGSLDVQDLYHSINVTKAGQICRDRVTNSGLKIERVNYKRALIYLDLTMSPSERVYTRVNNAMNLYVRTIFAVYAYMEHKNVRV